MSTLAVNTLQAQTGTTVSIPTGNKIVGTDATSIVAPGMVIQTVTNTSTTTVNSSSTSASDLITASITPQFTNSIIHIEGYVSRMQVSVSSNAYASLYIADPSGSFISTAVMGSAISNSSPMTVFGTHSPSSTSSQTYKLRLSCASGGTSSTGTDGQRYTIKLMEIAQ
jgi:hypothetical protein